MTDYSKIADQLYATDPEQALAPAVPQPAVAAPPVKNKYSAAADQVFGEQDARLRTSVFGASMANPDAAARARKIAERTGMAPDAVERNLPTAERQVLVEDVDQHTRDTPALRQAYGTPYFAKAAKDDLFNLTAVEKAVRRLMDPTADDRKGSREAVGAVGSFLAEGAKQIGMGATVGLGAGIADLAGFGADALSGMTGSTTLEAQALTYRRIAERANEAMDYFSKKATGNIESGLQSGFRSGGQNLALLPLGVARGATSMLLPMVSMVGAGSFNKAREKGQDRIDAAIYAAPDAVFEYAFEKLPASRLLADIAKNSGLMTMVSRQLLPEVLGEQATTVLQDLNEWVRLNPQKTVSEFIAERPDAAVQTLVATLVGVGVQTGTVRGVQRILGHAAEQETKARDATVRASNLAELFDIAAGSKLRGRDATTFGDFVQQAAEAADSPIVEVHVDAVKLDEVLNQAGVSREAFAAMSPTAAAAIDEALQSGSSVPIPIGDLVGRMGDTGIEKALLPHLRTDIDGLSLEEAAAEQAAAQQLLQQDAERVIQQANDSQAVEDSAERVRSVMFAQLQATGRFSADVNRAYTTMVGSFYTSLAARLGVTPEQAYAQFPLRVQGVAQGGESLQQDGPIGAAMQEKIDADFGAAVEEYSALPESNGGQVINTDLARELSPEYQADRTRSAEVHEAASAFAKRMYADKLSRPTPEGKLPTVLFTGGGTGAGKSTGLNMLAESSDAEIVYDTNMNGEQSSVTKIEQALAAGRNVHILYTYRDPVEALTAGALPRAMRMGRTVPLSAHLDTHVGARTTAEKIAARYAGDPRVVISVVDNSRGRGKAVLTTLDKIPQVVESGLKEKLHEATQAEYAAGRISEAVARGTTGESPVTFGEGGPGVRSQLEQADSAPPAQLSDFTPENLPGLLGKGNWSIFTAADPGATKRSDAENDVAMAALRQDLDDIGLEYIEAIGKYGDTQPSFIVVGIPERVAQALGNKYGQESILTNKGLIYQDGSITPATGIEVFDTAPEDFYTEVPGTGAFFSVALDFESPRVQPDGVFNQSGRAEGDTRYQDRAVELLADLEIPKRSAAGIMSGREQAPLLPLNFDIARYFTRKYPAIYDTSTPSAQKAIVDALYADTLQALTDNGSAVGWYDRKVKAALELVAELHPEIATNEEAKFGFIVMLAITSNRTRVNENMELAEGLYRAWKATGKWPTAADIPKSQAQGEIIASMELMQRLIAQHGWQAARDFMSSDHTIAEIEAFSGSKVGGELAGSQLYGAVFLGSKIGAFFNNLYGNYGPVTMDRWFVRTVSRVRGRMLTLPGKFGQNIDKLEAQLATGIDTFGVKPEAIIKEIEKYRAMAPSRQENVEAVVKAMPHTRKYLAERWKKFAKGTVGADGKKHSFSERTKENTLAKALHEALTVDKIVPSGGNERADFRAIAVKLQQRLKADGLDIVMADLQAILWYYEKDLFARLKGENRQGELGIGDSATAEAEDYETAARRLLRLVRGEGSGRPGSARPGQRPAAKRAVETRTDTTGDFFAQSAVEDTATQVEQRRMRQAVDLALLQSTPQSDAFVSWFGNSKVVKDGKPLVMHHATSAGPFEVFNTPSYFSENAEDAKGYGSRSETVFVRITNPYWAQDEQDEENRSELTEIDEDYAAELQAQGYDGVMGMRNGETLWAVPFSPQQIKSATDNVGTFDANEPSILKQTAPGMKPGEVAITGVHFSTKPGLNYLNGKFYGTGLKGVEKERVRNSEDKRLSSRTYFYVDEGKGVRPESGVGGNAHEAQLTNLYDIMADPLKLIVGGDLNATESNVLNAGFDGYYRRDAFNQQGAAVVLGPASHAIPVRPIANPTTKAPPLETAPAVYKRALMNDEIERMNIAAVQAVAPSAKLRMGAFQVLESEREAAAAVAKMQGIDLPAAYAQGEGTRGTFSPSSLTITLLEDADLSTFLHETGHFMLEAMANVASRVDAPADVRQDMATVLNWFGVKDLDSWNAMSLKDKTASHEKFAEGFEAYLFEGKAPSVELQTVFRRFRSWLQNVYQSLTAFMRTHNTQLSDEVRAVFDRLLASEEAITQAEDVAGMLPSEDATAVAIERLSARSLRDLKWTVNARSKALRVLQKQAADLRAAVKVEAKAEVDNMPVFIAREALAKLRPDAEHGVDTVPQEEAIAEANGYTGVDHMLQDVLAAGSKAAMVEELTDQRMLERYGDLIDQRAIEAAANEEVHNEARAKSLATELAAQEEALGAREDVGTTRTGRRVTVNILMRAAKHFASNVIGRTTVRDLPARNRQHLAAERRAGQAWLKATAAGQSEDAIRAKKDQVLNNAAAREAIAAQAEVAKDLDYFNKFNKKGVRASLPQDYLDQIDRLLESLDLRKSTTGRAIDKRQSLREWVASQQALGIDPVLPDYILNGLGKTSYKELTVDEVRGLRDTIKNIEHLARLKSKLLKAKDQRDFDAIVDELAASIREHGGTELPVKLEPDGKIAQFFKGAWVDHRKLNSLIHQMDGGKDNGPFYRALVRSMNDAGVQESVMLEKATKALADIFAPVERLPGGLSGGNVFIPEIRNTLSRAGRLSIALNTGNAQNLQRIMGGDGWTQAQVDAVMATLTRPELEFVNKVWEHIDSYWPEIKAKQLRVSGVVEDKVEAEPFDITMTDGTVVHMRGGYYPIKYDSDRSIRAEKNEAVEKASEIMRGAVMRPTTRRGHTKARVDEVSGRPLRKDLSGLTQHINQVVHDLAWHEWFIDANRLLNDPRLHGAIRDHYGAQTGRAMRDAINAIAVGDAVHQGQIDQLLLRMRSSVTRSIMGVSVTTAFLQPFGLTQSMARIGVMPVLKGAARWAGDAVHMESTVGWVSEKSDFMRKRSTTFNRELREINQRLQGKSKFARIADASLFMAMQKMQMVADIPTWVGMYEKALAGGVSEDTAVALADEAVLASQGGGTIKDLSAVQRNMPFLTQFYSYFNTTMNLVAEKTALTDFKNPRAVAGWLADMALLTVIPSILPALITFAMKGGGDDDDDLGTWALRLGDWYAEYMFGMFVGLRELPTLWSPFDYGGPPAAKLLNDGKRLVQQADQGEIDDGLVLAAIGFLGTGLGLPTTQLIRSYKGWQAWDEGDAPATSILFGPPPKG